MVMTSLCAVGSKMTGLDEVDSTVWLVTLRSNPAWTVIEKDSVLISSLCKEMPGLIYKVTMICTRRSPHI